MLTIIAPLVLFGGLVAPSASAPEPNAGHHYSLFGFDVCVGASAEPAKCDLRLPAPPPELTKAKAPEPTPGVFTLFGKTLCLDNAPAHARCDLRVRKPVSSIGA